MWVLLYEFLTSGGLWAEPLPADVRASLAREGIAMLTALASDFGRIPGCRTVLLVDARSPEISLPNCVIVEVASSADEKKFLVSWSGQADGTVLIAPETGGLLARRTRWIEAAGSPLLGCGSELVELTADKQRTCEFLRGCGLPIPTGQSLRPGDPWPEGLVYPQVLKPRDGAGSQQTYLLSTEAGARSVWASFQGPARVEEFCPGLAASVSVLAGPAAVVPLLPGQQLQSSDGRFSYLGGEMPLSPDLAERAQRLAQRAVEALPDPRGYLGVDLVLGPDPSGSQDRVVEINPRLTTSYVGLRAACADNLAELWLRTVQGHTVVPSWHAGRRWQYSPAGLVQTWLS